MEYLYVQDGFYDIPDYHFSEEYYDIDGKEQDREKVSSGTVLILPLSPYGDDDLPY